MGKNVASTPKPSGYETGCPVMFSTPKKGTEQQRARETGDGGGDGSGEQQKGQCVSVSASIYC